MNTNKRPFTTGSGNIFIDLGFTEEEAVELSIRACLFHKLQDILRKSKISQKELANRLGVKQPRISEIINGRMSGFSTERIAKYLLRLGYNIYLDARPSAAPSRIGKILELRKRRLA